MATISAKVVAAIVITVLIFGGIMTYLIYRSTRSNDTDPVDPPDPTICGVVDIATVTASSTLNAGHMAENLFDGNPLTSWHSAVGKYEIVDAIAQSNDLLGPSGAGAPKLVGQWVTGRLLKPSTIYAYTMWPRSVPGSRHEYVGHPKGWTIVVSDDGSTWRSVQSESVESWTAEKRVQLAKPIVDATYIGIVVQMVSGTPKLSSPEWCAFNGLEFHCT